MSTGKKLDVIGHARRRIDSREKVTGQMRYADDMKLPRMLHMKLLRSSHPHALIEAIDIARAQAYPGVHLVLTGKDFPVPFGIMPVAQDEYPLAPEHVRYVGDPVAHCLSVPRLAGVVIRGEGPDDARAHPPGIGDVLVDVAEAVVEQHPVHVEQNKAPVQGGYPGRQDG